MYQLCTGERDSCLREVPSAWRPCQIARCSRFQSLKSCLNVQEMGRLAPWIQGWLDWPREHKVVAVKRDHCNSRIWQRKEVLRDDKTQISWPWLADLGGPNPLWDLPDWAGDRKNRKVNFIKLTT
jgi:hypothetical protein